VTPPALVADAHVRAAAPPTSTHVPDDAPPPASAPPPAPAARALARAALAAAVGLGLLADLLLRAPLGLNVAVLTAALLAALGWLARRRGRPVTVGAVLLGALALAFAAAVAWRDAGTLVALDVLALWSVLCTLAPAVLHGDALPVERAGPADYARGALRVTGLAALGAPSLAGEGRVRELAGGDARARAGTVARGAALAAPALLVFTLLFASADVAFERLVGRLLGLADGSALLGHALGFACGAWVAGGFLHAALLARRDEHAPPRGARAGAAGGPPVVGTREVVVALVLVDALFAVFVALQLGWLFGGAPVVGAATGVSYAEYARRGFFELVAVAALALPGLLAAHARVAADASPAARRARRRFGVAAGVLVACVLVVLVSAADRMRLYVDAYGLTEARFYATAFMAWLAAVFTWAAAALLRNRPASFAVGALTSAWTWLLALNVVNPEARIVAVNAARIAEGRPFDATYVTALSADAVPALAARALPALAARGLAAEACAMHRAIDRAGRPSPAEADWRAWTASRAHARRVARRLSAEMRLLCPAE
jgi:hypothetical protein